MTELKPCIICGKQPYEFIENARKINFFMEEADIYLACVCPNRTKYIPVKVFFGKFIYKYKFKLEQSILAWNNWEWRPCNEWR